jgi:hypothetical protein
MSVVFLFPYPREPICSHQKAQSYSNIHPQLLSAVFALMASTKGKGMYEPLKGQLHDLTCVSEVSEVAEMSHSLGQQSADHLTPASAYLSIGGSGASKEPAGSRRLSVGSKNPSDGPKRIFSKILGQPATSSEGSPIIQEPNPPASAAIQSHGNKPTPKTVTGGDGGMKPEIKFHVFEKLVYPRMTAMLMLLQSMSMVVVTWKPKLLSSLTRSRRGIQAL